MGNRLGDLISRGEGGYNSYNRGSAGDARSATIDFSRMTLGEIQREQHLPRRDPDRLFAVGKYQIIPRTMDAAVDALKLDANQRFTPELQERIFAEYLIARKRPDIHGYITGRPGVSLHDAQDAVAAEWASVADPDTGRSKYGGVGGNRASIPAGQVAEALNAMRTEYRAQVDRGISPQEAWELVSGLGQGASQNQFQASGNATHQEALARSLLKQGEVGPVVRELQKSMNDLGYRDAQGRPLRVDGDFGLRTKEAVQAFQRAHGLQDDGIAGPRTFDALKKAEQSPLLSNPKHRDHPLFTQALEGLQKMGQQAGFKSREELERVAATLAFEAKASGLSQIDHVMPSTSGAGLFAVQGGLRDPAHHRVHVDKLQAVGQPVEQSTYQLQQDAGHRHTPEQPPQPQTQTREPRTLLA